jgi:signal peptide peptidase SppA
MKFSSLRRALNGKLWFVHEQKMNEIVAFLELKLSGGSADPDVVAAIRAANEASAMRSKSSSAAGGAVAVIPCYGLIMHRPAMDLSGPGGTSCQMLSQQLRQAVDDPGVSAILMDIDSPGGDTDGVDELASEIYNARKQKKITAVSNSLCASAAYYLASQCSEVVCSPSSLTGSIGVYCMHEDDSEMLANLGVKMSIIKFGENKAEGNPLEPLSDSARAHLQEMVDTFGVMFEKAVARGRGVSRDEVHAKFGQGRVFDAKQAVKLGLADRVGTLDEVLQQYGVSRGSGASSRAAEESPDLQAEARRRQIALTGA